MRGSGSRTRCGGRKGATAMPETFSSLSGEIARLRELLRTVTAEAERLGDLVERIDAACEANPATMTAGDVRRMIAEAERSRKELQQ